MSGGARVSADFLLAAAGEVGDDRGPWALLQILIQGEAGPSAPGSEELAAFEAAPGSRVAAERLAAALAARAAEDAAFRAALDAWQGYAGRLGGGVFNVITGGTFHGGPVIQARDVAIAPDGPETPVFAPEQELGEDYPPSFLLRAEYGVVPFVGRVDELEALDAWCGQPARVAVGLITAAGGSGKTRLARELCRRRADEGWTTGFIHPEARPTSVSSLPTAGARYLFVIDYAETSSERVRAIGRPLAAAPAERIRLLLVARSAGDWWEKLRENAEDDRFAALLYAVAELPLGPLVPGAADRRTEFARARDVFARRLGVAPGQAPPPADVGEARYGLALALHMAALATVLDRADPRAAPSAWRDPATRVLDHERRYWRRGAVAAGLTELGNDALDHVVAAATLVGAADRGAALRLLKSVPELADQPEAVVRRCLAWAGALHPGPGALNPLEPDLLGEDHVAGVIHKAPELVGALRAAAADDRLERLLSVLARTAARHEHVAPVLRSLVAEHSERLLPLAVDVATRLRDPRPLADAITRALPGILDPLALIALYEALPRQTVALADLAVEVVRSLVRLAEVVLPSGDPHLGGYLNDLAVRLGDAGQVEQALATADRAVQALRSTTHRASLAAALSTRGNQLYRLGRVGEAQDAYREAVQLLEADPDHKAQLASALSMLAALGSPDGLADSRRALAILRPLADGGPPDVRAQHATALVNHANLLSAARRHTDAVDAAETAVRILRPLAAESPDTFIQPMLTALDTRNAILGRIGRFEGALASAREAVELVEDIAARHPGRHEDSLHRVLGTYAGILASLGRGGEAFEAISRTVDLCRTLVAQRPDANLGDLAHDIGNLTGVATRTDHCAQALDILAETLAQVRGLGERARPQARVEAVAAILVARCQLLDRLGRYDEAAEAGREAVALLRAAEMPRRARLAVAAAQLAGAEVRAGTTDAALQLAREAVEVCRTDSEVREVARRDTGMLLDQLANRLTEAGQNYAAREASDYAVTLMRDVATDNPFYELDLAQALHNHAVRLWGHSRVFTPWREVIDESITLRRRWTGQSAEAREELELSLRFRQHAQSTLDAEETWRMRIGSDTLTPRPDDPGADLD